MRIHVVIRELVSDGPRKSCLLAAYRSAGRARARVRSENGRLELRKAAWKGLRAVIINRSVPVDLS